MQEIGQPDARRIEEKEGQVVHLGHREQSIAQVTEQTFGAHGSPKASCKDDECEQNGQDAQGRYHISCSRKLSEHAVHRQACLPAEADEHGNLAQYCRKGEQQNHDHVYHPFRHHAPHRTGETYTVVAAENGASQHLSHSRQHQAAGIADEDGGRGGAMAGMFSHGGQRLLPPECPEHL